mmetsp:Transcript_13007/g.17732  ORF Transcript_13007/g.17732 Transcript_13007/m.17732 type:complete len:89 (+) Transcript_13007:150-416(+)
MRLSLIAMGVWDRVNIPLGLCQSSIEASHSYPSNPGVEMETVVESGVSMELLIKSIRLLNAMFRHKRSQLSRCENNRLSLRIAFTMKC